MTDGRRAALITGAARRVGKAIALGFAAKGYDIALHYHTSRKEAEATRKEIRAIGVDCQLFSLDLTKIGKLQDLADTVLARMPHCNILINNASYFEPGRFLTTDEALFDRQFNINFKAPFFLMQAFVKRCPEARVANILDTNIVRHHTSHCAYLLAKKALADLTCMAALELAPKARVNGLCLGSALPADNENPDFTTAYTARMPLKQGTALTEVVEALLYLINTENMTGELLFLDGGRHLT